MADPQATQSILSHIPKNINYSKIKLFVLIYAPGLKDTAVEASTGELPPASVSSSFTNIDHAQAQSPKDEKSPMYVTLRHVLSSFQPTITNRHLPFPTKITHFLQQPRL